MQSTPIKFYQCSYCQIYFTHEGEERAEKPENFAGDHGACLGCAEKWKADLRKRLLTESETAFTH